MAELRGPMRTCNYWERGEMRFFRSALLALSLCGSGVLAQSAEPVDNMSAALNRTAFGVNAKPGKFSEVLDSLSSVGGQNVEHTSAPSMYSKEQIIQQQANWRNSLRSFHVDYSLTAEFVDPDLLGDANKQKLASDADPKNNGRYARSIIICDLESGRFMWQEFDVSKPTTSRKTVFDGRETKLLEASEKAAVVTPGRAFNIQRALGLFFFAIGHVREAHANDWSYFVPRVLRERQFVVLPTLQRVDGHLCHVVTCGFRTYWIDHNHGGCIRRYVEFATTGADVQYRLAAVLVCQDMMRLSDEIEWPTRVHNFVYHDFNERPEKQGMLREEQTVVVNKATVNDVDDTEFDLKLPAGAFVEDRGKNVLYAMPGGEKDLDDAVEKGLQIVNGKTAGLPLSRIDENVMHYGRWVLICINVLFLVAALVFFIWRRTA